jgi:CBS domain-containing protein
MANRAIAYVIKDQKPLVLGEDEAVRRACQCMWERRSGSVLVIDGNQRLSGIFTGRDAVRLLAKGKDAGDMPLAKAMTRDPVTISPGSRTLDALRAMSEGGFRHVPVTETGIVKGVVSRANLKGMEIEELGWQSKAGGSPGTYREIAHIIEHQEPLILSESETVREACLCMQRQKIGCVLVANGRQKLSGIFTGRDAVRALAKIEDAAAVPLADAMTRDPMTIAPQSSAIDALRSMSDGGFRHLPVVADGRIIGVVSWGDFTAIEIDRLDEEEHLKEVIW